MSFYVRNPHSFGLCRQVWASRNSVEMHVFPGRLALVKLNYLLKVRLEERDEVSHSCRQKTARWKLKMEAQVAGGVTYPGTASSS